MHSNSSQAVREAVSSVYETLALEKVLINVRDPQTGQITQIVKDRATPPLHPSVGYSPIEVALTAH
jgi:hypothetical protein